MWQDEEEGRKEGRRRRGRGIGRGREKEEEDKRRRKIERWIEKNAPTVSYFSIKTR